MTFGTSSIAPLPIAGFNTGGRSHQLPDSAYAAFSALTWRFSNRPTRFLAIKFFGKSALSIPLSARNTPAHYEPHRFTRLRVGRYRVLVERGLGAFRPTTPLSVPRNPKR